MKNKNRIFRAAALLLVLCFISTVMISGTFAKYTSEYVGEDTALVAKWSFTGDVENVIEGEDLPIWGHKYVENIYANNGTNYLIAPGVQGAFTVDFSYDADVDAALTLEIKKSGNIGANNEAAPVPIQYSLDGFDTTKPIYYDLDELADAIIAEAVDAHILIEDTTGDCIIENTAIAGSATTFSQTVSWRWPYDVDKHNNTKLITAGFIEKNETWTDADDTNIGMKFGRDDYVLTLTMKAEQIEPATTTP